MLQIWKQIYNVVNDTTLNNLLDDHSELFKPGLGKLKTCKLKFMWILKSNLNFARLILFPSSVKTKLQNRGTNFANGESIIESVHYAD